MLSKLKLRPYPTQFEKREGDFRNVQVHEINKLVDEVNAELATNEKTVVVTVDESELISSIPLYGKVLIPGIPRVFFNILSVTLKSDVSVKYLSPTSPDFLYIQGPADIAFDLSVLGDGKRFAKVIQPNLAVNTSQGLVFTGSSLAGEDVMLFTYQGVDMTQGVGSLEITIVYEEIPE